MSPVTLPPPEDSPSLVVILRWRVTTGLLVVLFVLMSLFYVRAYARWYDPQFGWTRLIQFGGLFESEELPRVRHIVHAVQGPTEGGYDGQFYAQLAIDPSLRDPGFKVALDSPTYRSRRIGLPAMCFVAGLGKPRYIEQVYALANLLFWFVLAAVLFRLFRPRTGRDLLCLCASLFGVGINASMKNALTDVPATAILFGGLLLGNLGSAFGLAVSTLTRETGVLAALGMLDPRLPWRDGAWRGQIVRFLIAVVPLALWLLYVNHLFGHAEHTVGLRNFDLPFRSMFMRVGLSIWGLHVSGISPVVFEEPLSGWLYADGWMNEILTVAGIFGQGLYLCLRPKLSSPIWRMGILYWALCLILGPAVWDGIAAVARAVLPMTVCFYLLVARERGWWFWPFFLLGSIALPAAVHELWTAT